MHSFLKFIAAAGTIAALTGCVSPEQFETAPVQLRTSKGIVTCQLYTKERVLWDRSIDRPASMSVKEADDICKTEGYRQKNEG